MYYSRPIYGRGFKPFSTETIEVTSENIDQWTFKKVMSWNKRTYAFYQNAKGQEMMQSLQAIRFIRLRPGEENYNAKLTNAEGIDIYKRTNAGESNQALAKEYNVSEGYVADIKNVRARIGVTLDYLNGTEKKKPAKGKTASRTKGKKLSPSLAKFIRSDHSVQKMNVKTLAKKYCVTDRTIQRILKGDMYSE